jgi:putative chitinase
MDRAVFYDDIRNSLFNGRLSQGQVDGMEAILNFWENPPVQPTGEFKVNWDIRSLG